MKIGKWPMACWTALCMMVAPMAMADDFPSKPIRMIVPFAAGGPADVVAREVAIGVGRSLHTSVVVENQGGALGATAIGNVARAAPDGYTLLFAASGNITLNPIIGKQAPEIVASLVPISLVSTSPHVLVVSAKLPVNTVPELIEYARQHPGQLNFASAGVGGLSHFGIELFKSLAKVDVVHVPYKGTSGAVLDLVSGSVQAIFTSMPSLDGLLQKGVIRVIGVTSETSSKALAGVPLISANGLPGFEYSTWYGVYAPPGTPDQVVTKVNGALAQVLKDPALIAKLDVHGLDVHGSTPQELARLGADDSAKWRAVVTHAGIKFD